jgi:hypothetical protein
MKTINRFALIVRPADPFIEWAAEVFNEPITKVRKELEAMEPSVYLVPESDAADPEDSQLLKPCWRTIFTQELDGWCTNEASWPQKRSLALFKVWFRLELCTIVSDLDESKIEHEIL